MVEKNDLMKEVIKRAEELIIGERKDVFRPLFEIANQKGQEIAAKLNADKTIVLLGTMFMDVARSKAEAEGRVQDHSVMSVEVVKKFLSNFDLNQDFKEKVYNCVGAHHEDIPFTCLEAEICANADCYKFLHPKGLFGFIGTSVVHRGFDVSLKIALSKIEEKHAVLSLDICKQELEPYYNHIKLLLTDAVKE
ncbi:MAG: HD domain-containing protein [Nanoarchaeota archaeon]|nr:HD domain-containing protein [Nanoarchaeota archaeon]MBU1854306.1 HD domain-containing protein [Nanoarchaeota archaeon]